LLASLLVLSLPNVAFACKCRFFKESEIVLAFEGVALNTKVEARHRDFLFGPVIWQEGTTEFKVIRGSKGDIRDRIRVWHTIAGSIPSIGVCGPEFRGGERYQVYAARDRNGRIYTSECNYEPVRTIPDGK